MDAVKQFLSGITRGIDGIVRFINAIYDFIIDLIEDLVYVVKITAQFVVQIPEYLGWLPAGALYVIVAIFAVVVVYKVLGREG